MPPPAAASLLPPILLSISCLLLDTAHFVFLPQLSCDLSLTSFDEVYKIDDRIADSHSYLCKYEDISHIQTHLSPDREESVEDPVEENVLTTTTTTVVGICDLRATVRAGSLTFNVVVQHQDHYGTAVTKIYGGKKMNALPSEVKAYINHRVHPNDTFENILEYDR
eukprot:scaffold1352_cov129-Chaetoceros_neogracile.AAC.2